MQGHIHQHIQACDSKEQDTSGSDAGKEDPAKMPNAVHAKHMLRICKQELVTAKGPQAYLNHSVATGVAASHALDGCQVLTQLQKRPDAELDTSCGLGLGLRLRASPPSPPPVPALLVLLRFSLGVAVLEPPLLHQTLHRLDLLCACEGLWRCHPLRTAGSSLLGLLQVATGWYPDTTRNTSTLTASDGDVEPPSLCRL